MICYRCLPGTFIALATLVVRADPSFKCRFVFDAHSRLATVPTHAWDGSVRVCSDFLQYSPQGHDVVQTFFKILATVKPRNTEVWRVVWVCILVATDDFVRFELRLQVRLR